MPIVEFWATAPETETASAAATTSALAQTRVVIRVSSGIPAFNLLSSVPKRKL